MIREERVAAVSYDAGKDELTLACEGRLPRSSGEIDGQLLLDKAGFLVGVDMGQEPDRVALMLGRHEDVERTLPVRVTIAGTSVRVGDAKKRARGHEKNPYRP
jgi:hypothetical protein